LYFELKAAEIVSERAFISKSIYGGIKQPL
jgi:hypothetical protein